MLVRDGSLEIAALDGLNPRLELWQNAIKRHAAS
jgi:hypothetical protein